MINSIGFIELNSIARGIGTADAMVKAAEVTLMFSKPVCPGKFIIMVNGDVGAVKASIASGLDFGGQYVVDNVLLASVHPELIGAINGTPDIEKVNSLGVIEFYSIAAAVVAADAAAKAANVTLIEVRLGIGIGGKSYVTLTGDVGAVNQAVEVGANTCRDSGMFINKIVIPSPRKEVFLNLM